MATVSIHKMELRDLPAVHSISQASFSSPWSLDAIQQEFYNEMAFYLTARDGETTIGFIGAWLVFDEAQITNIAVALSSRRQGVAKLLLQHFIQAMADMNISVIFLEVRVSNTAARKLYEGLGFQYSGYRKNFYPDKEDAHLMSLELS